jgi:hypothetical protein
MVALVSPIVVVSIMAVGMAMMNLATKNAILIVVRHYVKFSGYSNRFSHFGHLCGRKSEAETLALMVLEEIGNTCCSFLFLCHHLGMYSGHNAC